MSYNLITDQQIKHELRLAKDKLKKKSSIEQAFKQFWSLLNYFHRYLSQKSTPQAAVEKPRAASKRLQGLFSGSQIKRIQSVASKAFSGKCNRNKCRL